jgi:hypothetical protein
MAVKVASLLAGALCMFFGYKLLMRGIYSDSNEKAVWDDRSLLLKRGAPGTVFALFGAWLIVVTLLQSGELRRSEPPSPVEQTETQPTESSDQPSAPQQGKPKDPRQRAPKERGASQPGAERKTTRHERTSPGEDSNQPLPTTTTTKERGTIAKPGRA